MADFDEADVEAQADLRGTLPELFGAAGGDELLEYLGFADGEITFPALVAFVAVDEFGHFGKAAKFLGKQQQGLRQHIKNLEETLNVQLLGVGPGGEYRAVGRVGRELRDRARLMVYQYGAIGRLSDNEIKIRYLAQHGHFMSSVEARLDELVDIQCATLGNEDRSVRRFHDGVVVPLAAGVIDFAVGPPPDEASPTADLVAPQYLYTSRHEAMVPQSDEREYVELAELVAEGRLLVAPANTRDRDLLEAAIARDIPNDPGANARVKRESFDTAVLIQYGMKGLGTVVMPSGIAYPFRHGRDYGGPTTGDFKWIPVCTSSGDMIYQEIYALVRRTRDKHSDQLAKILNLIRQEIAQLGMEQSEPEPDPS